jgi:hypothetical protein
MDNKIIIGDTEYIKDIDQNGELILKRYNNKYKMWVNIYFAKESDEKVMEEIQDVALDILIN